MNSTAPSFALQHAPRVRFKNILFATDLGPASATAQAYALLLARRFGSHLFVLHVEEGSGVAKPAGDLSPSYAAEIAAAQDLAKLEKIFVSANVPFSFVVERGEVQKTLNRVAADLDIDLIVLGTHGRHGLSYLLFGSIAEGLGRSSTRPVITVGPRAIDGFEPLQHILYATDFSEESRFALPYAASLAQEFNASLTIAHVAPAVERTIPDREYLLLHQLKGLAPEGQFPWCSMDYAVAFGDTAGQILRLAKARTAELIVLGLHNSVRFTSHLPERLAYYILCDATCPVLSVLPEAVEPKPEKKPLSFPNGRKK